MTEGAEPAAIGPFVVLRKLGEGGMGVVYAGYDVALDRKVALKLIRRSLIDRSEVRARMIREAQAMARLSHPNVVQVYQVGEHGDGIYVAMEYVEGQTLTAWLRTEKRPWQLVLRTVVAAGRGLAAAHAAGLVHRDFKPDNVLVSKDGRPCVLDFGLVHAENSPALPIGGLDVRTSVTGLPTISRMSTQPSGPGLGASGSGQTDRGDVLDIRLTRAGKALGTPAYMSPEQHFGDEAVGPASDQFSFGTTLYEALYGSRPFPGATWEEIKREVRRGIVPPPPRDSAVPGRIFRIIVRSLAPTPDMRWPSLEHMLAALERDPRKTMLRAAGIVAVAGAAAAGSYALALSQREASMQCQGLAAELAGVWDDARARAAERAFVATGSPFAADTWRRVDARLDAYALAWTEGRTQACEAHASGSQSTTLFDRRTACLARRRAYLSALVDVFIAADRSVIENAVQATAALPSLESCADADALLAAVAPPDDPHAAAQVDARRSQLARAAVLEGTGQYAEGLQLAREVRAAAEELHYPPLTAEAALGEGSLLMAVARVDEAEAALTAALKLGIVHGLDAIAAEAAAKRIFVVGEGQGRRRFALDDRPVAEALAERADDDRIAALLHNNLGAVYERENADVPAREQYMRTLELLGRNAGPPDPLMAIVHHNLGGLHQRYGRLTEAREQFVRARSLFSELLGERHPMVAHPIASLAEIDQLEGKLDAAAENYNRALALMEELYGPEHLYLLQPLGGLAKLQATRGDTAAAVATYTRGIAIGERAGTTHPYYSQALVGLAELVPIAEARSLLARAITAYETDGGPKNPAIAPVAVRAGELAVAANDLPAARQWFERVLADATGSKEQLATRALAALRLARLLLDAGERQRACSLLLDARVGLTGDAPRADLDALEAACAR
ncbi:Protein tyrosine kinase [Nannocystis exedens]|uniref:Protein tyrosine kinase n=1 Tax=Nannocystis exedens TaxID=54 RepID=A0A1I2DDF5_9BACT|nr:serine/threonine-protein kinase [Nannocystis exedens]PCC70574.1 serine/threonine protein kinase [Nannocystis exedens]SFE78576.1 Protein tyrosine kinase [Nannocystis exedens]